MGTLHNTPSIGLSKGKRINSIAELIAKKKRKRSMKEENEKCADLNVAAMPNKKRKLNLNADVAANSEKEENEKIIAKNKKNSMKKKKKRKKKKKDLQSNEEQIVPPKVST